MNPPTATSLTPIRTNRPVNLVDERGETVLYDRDGGKLLVLNDVGAGVWTLIDGQRSIDDIAAIVVEHLPAPLDTVARDVAAFVAQLQGHELIETP